MRGRHVDEIIFVVEEAPEGGYSARALGVSIFSEADDVEVLQKELRDAVLCHFDDESERPRMIRLHFVRDRLLAVTKEYMARRNAADLDAGSTRALLDLAGTWEDDRDSATIAGEIRSARRNSGRIPAL
jgi:hypothetical protein